MAKQPNQIKISNSPFLFNLDAKIYTALVMLYVAIALTCDIVAFKMVKIGGLTLMASAFLFPLLYVFTDMITELYGAKSARFAVLVHAGGDFFYSFSTIFFISLPSPHWWHHQAAFNTVVLPMGRLWLAGMLGDVISAFINIHFLAKWKRQSKGKYFWLRSTASTAIGIIVYTITTDLFAFNKALSNAHLIQVTSFNVGTNVLFATLYIFVASFLVNFIKKGLKIDHSDNMKTPNPLEV